jgi:hypothetical protein
MLFEGGIRVPAKGLICAVNPVFDTVPSNIAKTGITFGGTLVTDVVIEYGLVPTEKGIGKTTLKVILKPVIT